MFGELSRLHWSENEFMTLKYSLESLWIIDFDERHMEQVLKTKLYINLEFLTLLRKEKD